MNTQNSKSNELHKFRLTLADKLNIKDLTKNMALANLVSIPHGKTLNQHTTTINLKVQHQLGMMNLICLMDHILLMTSKITLNLSSKNTKF